MMMQFMIFLHQRRFLKIFEKKNFKFIEMMLPGLILNVVLYDNQLSRTSRIHALLIGFFFLYYLTNAQDDPSRYLYKSKI